MKLRSITETSDQLNSLVQYGLAKFNSLMTPSRSDDIEMMLSILHPDLPGVSAIDKLVDIAERHEGNLFENDNWWMNMAVAFGFTSDEVRNHVKIGVLKEFPELFDATKSNDQKPTTQTTQTDKKTKLNPKNAKKARQVIGGMLNKLANDNRSESIERESAIAEGFTDTINSVRNLLSNPKYATEKLNTKRQQLINSRIAKLAVLRFSDILKKQFEYRLRQAGYNIPEIVKLIKYRNKLYELYVDDETGDKYAEALAKLDKEVAKVVYKLSPRGRLAS